MNNQKQSLINYLGDRLSILKKELITQIQSDVNILLIENAGMNQVRIRSTCRLAEMGENFYVDLRGIEKDKDNNFILRVERHSDSWVDEYEDTLEAQDLEGLFEIILQLNGQSELTFSKD